jgi:hypothetical protein
LATILARLTAPLGLFIISCCSNCTTHTNTNTQHEVSAASTTACVTCFGVGLHLSYKMLRQEKKRERPATGWRIK